MFIKKVEIPRRQNIYVSYPNSFEYYQILVFLKKSCKIVLNGNDPQKK